MAVIAGSDGCAGGWLTIWRTDSGPRQAQVFPNPEAIWDALRPDILAVDIPIGLCDSGPRLCDGQARQLLRHRSSCVFTPPCRANLHAETRQKASEITQLLCSKGVAAQHYGIYAFVREWDLFFGAHPEAVGNCFEVHPELIFRHLNNGEPASTKHKEPGRVERREILLRVDALDEALSQKWSRFEGDFLDASAALWTAERIWAKTAFSILDPIPRDSAGLAMTMWI